MMNIYMYSTPLVGTVSSTFIFIIRNIREENRVYCFAGVLSPAATYAPERCVSSTDPQLEGYMTDRGFYNAAPHKHKRGPECKIMKRQDSAQSSGNSIMVQRGKEQKDINKTKLEEIKVGRTETVGGSVGGDASLCYPHAAPMLKLSPSYPY